MSPTETKKSAITASSIARMAGNIAAGLVTKYPTQLAIQHKADITTDSVELALMIADETERALAKE